MELDRERGELLINPNALGISPLSDPSNYDALTDLGAALLHHLRHRPAASDEQLSFIARAATAPLRDAAALPS